MLPVSLRVLFVISPLLFSSAFAAVKMPAIFGDHMVLQQGTDIPVWGWATSGEKITVSLATQKLTTTADA